MNIIHFPKEAKFLSDFMTELPIGIFNKVSTGCGGTTIALESPYDYIVCVPSVNLVESKVSQYPRPATPDREGCDYEVLKVCGGVDADDIKRYLHSHNIHKIMTTYDGLYKIANLVDLKKYRILVDEYQTLLKAYSYRYRAINNMLSYLKDHPYVTYMTATPIDPEYSHEALKDLEYSKIEFETFEKIRVTRERTNHPEAKAAAIIEEYKKGGFPFGDYISNQAYFFVNSVTMAVRIAEKAGLTASETNFCLADNESNAEYLSKHGYKLGSVKDADCTSKQFHFLTSCSFEGVDIYSDRGLTFIVSNANNPNTLLDISTDIVQIAGRIRSKSNPLKGDIVHIYKTKSFDDSEESKWEKELAEWIEDAKKCEANYYHEETARSTKKSLKDSVNRHLSASTITDPVFQLMSINDKGDIFFDEYKVVAMNYTRKVMQAVYRDGLRLHVAYENAGKFEFNGNQHYTSSKDLNISLEVVDKKPRFKDLCKEYVNTKRKSNLTEADELRLRIIENRFNIIREAYDKLGADKLGTLKYEEKNIIEALISYGIENNGCIKDELKRKLRVGKRYTNKELKELFKSIYDVLRIKKTAKASDIEEYAVCDKYRTSSERGYEIIGFRPDPKPESETPISASADNQPVIKVEQYSLLNHPAFKACERRQE
jgi:hypothetical protein